MAVSSRHVQRSSDKNKKNLILGRDVWPNEAAAEMRVDMNDGKTYTIEGVKAKFGCLFSAEEVATLRSEMESAHAAAQARDPFPENVRRGCRMLSDRTPLFQGLSEDRRFLGAARQMYGDVFSYGCDAGYYMGDTQWHAGESAGAAGSLPLC